MDRKEDLSTTEGIVALSSNNNVNDAAHMAATKGKRTKRLRLLSPCGGVAGAANTTVMTSSCSSASGASGDDQGSLSISSATTTDQEEEDMANCLILLAQGGGGGGGGGVGGDSHNYHHHQQHLLQQVDQDQDHGDDGNNKIEVKGRKFSEMGTAIAATTATTNKVGFYIYECKTCNRTFPSFQALGGHRASHKKPKLMAEEKKPPPPATLTPSSPPSPPPPLGPQVTNTNNDHHQFELGGGGGQQPHIKSVPAPINPISLQSGSAHKANFNGNNNKAKIHECSVCGSEFTSGQALGGHMRRHRASTNTSTQPMSGIETTCNVTEVADAVTVKVEVQPRNILELDLNLPAPEEDLREPKFQFTAATQKSMVLSATPALVDCHY